MRRHKGQAVDMALAGRAAGINEDEWARSGRKWIVFDKEEKILNLAEKLAPSWIPARS